MSTTEELLNEIDNLPELDLENDPDFLSDVTKGILINDILVRMEEKNLSQKDLANKLGKSKQYVSRILNEKTNLTIDSLTQIACALDSELNINFSPFQSDEFVSTENASLGTSTIISFSELKIDAPTDHMESTRQNNVHIGQKDEKKQYSAC